MKSNFNASSTTTKSPAASHAETVCIPTTKKRAVQVFFSFRIWTEMNSKQEYVLFQNEGKKEYKFKASFLRKHSEIKALLKLKRWTSTVWILDRLRSAGMGMAIHPDGMPTICLESGLSPYILAFPKLIQKTFPLLSAHGCQCDP